MVVVVVAVSVKHGSLYPPPYMCGSKILVKNRFFRKFFCKNAQKRQKNILYVENYEKSLFPGKFHQSIFFGPLEGGWKPPPTPMYARHLI